MLMWWASVVSAVAGMSLAFSATRWSSVETSSELGLPAIFPSCDSVTRCLPSLHGVLSGEFPRFLGTIRHSDSPVSFPTDLAFTSYGGTAHVAETREPPRFLENPHACMPRSKTPVGSQCQ